tara:strand:+ start:155 stop:424 length:270 start_codon:yes stop_codon:yes gene_type:complete
MTEYKRRFDLHELVDLMEDSIEKISNLGKRFNKDGDDLECKKLRLCLRHLYDAHEILDQECLEHESSMLEIVIRMVEEEIQNSVGSAGI